jgi:hypothetical protein
LVLWERATDRNRPLSPKLAEHTRKGENVATWSATRGYEGGPVLAAAALEVELNRREEVFERYFHGASLVEDPQSGELRAYYNSIQARLGQPDLHTRDRWLRRRDQVIRLLFYPQVSQHFWQAYGTRLEQAIEACPNFGRLNRRQFMDVASSLNYIDFMARPLVEALRDLRADLLPERWI